MVKYIRNEFGGVHSIDNEVVIDSDGNTMYDLMLVVTPAGNRLLPAGWAELTEAEAKKANPELFGKPDARIHMNARELADAAALNAILKE